MSLHLYLLNESNTGSGRRLIFNLSFEGPYPANGEPLDRRTLLLWNVWTVAVTAQGGFSFWYERPTGKLHAYTFISTIGGDVPVVFTEPGDPIGSPMKVAAGVVAGLNNDIPVVFTEPGDPINAPAKVSAADVPPVFAGPGEVPPGTDLSFLRDLQLVAEGL